MRVIGKQTKSSCQKACALKHKTGWEIKADSSYSCACVLVVKFSRLSLHHSEQKTFSALLRLVVCSAIAQVRQGFGHIDRQAIS